VHYVIAYIAEQQATEQAMSPKGFRKKRRAKKNKEEHKKRGASISEN